MVIFVLISGKIDKGNRIHENRWHNDLGICWSNSYFFDWCFRNFLGLRLTKNEHIKEKYVDDTTETVVLFLLSLLLKYLPYWLMRGALILFGLAIIILGVLIVLSI